MAFGEVSSRQLVRLSVAVVALAFLAGCEEGSELAFLQPKDEAPAAEPAPKKSTKLVERDVESPEVFQVTEAGLWDGRPSLGGVWVAHPDVTDPERVIIRNSANDKFVIGALFRRERDNPGPRIQASSDAAAALGMLAGAPVELNVTALRREVEPDPTPEPTSEPAPEPTSEPSQETAATIEESSSITESDLDPIAGAAAAIDASEPTPAAAATAAPESEAAAAAKKPKKKGFVWPWTKVGEPLDAMDPAKKAVTPAAAATGAAEAPQTKSSPLDKPFIQIGIYNFEANANSAADQVRGSGIIPTVYDQTANGKRFWRVVVGPAQSRTERNALIKQVQSAGFSDAYAVTD